MPTYSEWLDSTRVLYTTAMTNAYVNRNNADTTNVYYRAWQAMNATGDLTSILAPNAAFYGATPDGDEADILLFQDWLQKNPDSAGLLNLEPTLSFRADQRSSLGTAGTVGTERRRWKGSPVYTFANGVLIGKDSQIVAAIGTEGGEDLDGFGTDTIAYFDGVPFSTGTGVPGSVVFRGDTVVSGSIRGTGGVIIIDDVIQLETGVSDPAGIGVDKDGKIRLRHRGEGFVDLVDEINTVQTNLDNSTNTAANLAKLWQGTQNTSSARWGTSLIPNGNMSLKTVDASDGYSDRLVGIRSIGTTSNIVTIPADGVGRFDASQGGIAFQAVPIEAERYAIRIRYRGGTQEQIDDPASDEGLFLSFHETTDDPDNMGDKTFVYNTGSTPGVLYEGSTDPISSDFYLANTNVQFLDNLTSTDAGGNLDGVTIQEDYQVKSYVYTPSAGTKSASLVIYARNYTDVIDIDYVVMTEQPLTTQQIEDLITDAVDDIDVEVDDPDISVITDPQMTSAALWAGYKGATLEDGTDGITGGDKAITVTITDPTGGGIISSAIACESDRYLVGAKVRVISSTTGAPVISMFAIENPDISYASVGASSTTPLQLVGSHQRKNISIVEVDPTGALLGTSSIFGQTVSIANLETDGVTPRYTTLVGTYEVTVAHIDGTGTDTGSYDATVSTTPTYPSLFSLVVETDRPCVISVDYVYGRVQGASVNIAQSLADTAYSDAHGFVTAMNEQLIKEAGSIITNASMSILDSNNLPSGWRTDLSSGTLSLDTDGDNAIRIVQDGVKTGTRRLITPAFSLGTSDQFSVGVRMRGLNGSVDATVKVAVCTDSVLPTGYVTIAGSDGGNTDVLVADTVTTTVTETEIATSEITEDRPLYHENLLTTWNRGQSSAGGLASIIVEADDDFEVDFVFVKEQSVSFDLADAQAIQRKDEAIASAAGFVANIGDSLADESGSFISNAGFSSWYVDPVTNRQRPQKWLVTRGAGSVRRAIPASEVTITTPADVVTAAQNKETVIDDKNISGSAIVFSPGTSEGGILSAKFQLPQGSSWTNPDSGATSTTTGSYTLSVRIRVDQPNLIGVRLYAHEMYSIPTGSEQHVFCEDGTYGSPTLEGLDRSSTGTPLDELKLFADTTEGGVQRIKVINVTKNDQSVGYDPDDGTGNSADEYVEYLPVDNAEDDGDRDGDFDEQVNMWYDISGTYKPSAGAKVVSFEILIDGDVDNSGTTSLIYIDYVSLITQPFDADFAQTLADARTESITGITSSGFAGSSNQNGGVNTTLAAAILANQSRLYNLDVALAAEDESTTLIPNSFFSDYGGTPSVPTSWMPTRNTDGSLVLETDRAQQVAAASYGTYLTLGGTDTTRGILSEAIPIIGTEDAPGITVGGLTSNPNFDIAVRYRSVNPVATQSSYSSYSQGARMGSIGNASISTASSAHTTIDYDPPTTYISDPTIRGKLGTGQRQYTTITGSGAMTYNISGDIAEFYDDEMNTYPGSGLSQFRIQTDAGWDNNPTITFTSPVPPTGHVRVYNLDGSVAFEQSYTSSTGPITITGLSSNTGYWVHAFWEGYDVTGISFQNNATGTVIIRHWTNEYFGEVDGANDQGTSSEPISLSIIAHEYYDTPSAYDPSTTQYVYANGATLVHPSSFDSVVQRYNTGADGAIKNLDAILKSDAEGNYTSIGTTTQTESDLWKTLVALYKPFELNEVLDNRPRWVSFEFILDGDPEGDNIIPEIYIDGILLQASTETPLLSAVKETADAANLTAGQAQDDATQALSDAGDALSKANTNEVTIGQHTTTLENIELAQTEAAIVQAGIASEQGSILFNAGFTQSISETNLALPKGYFPFQRTPGLFRITNETGSLTSADLPAFGTQGTDQSYNATSGLYESTKSIYLDVGQTGSALVVTGTDRQQPYTSGFYTTAMPLPKVTANVISTSDGSTNTQVDRGNYSIAIKVKPAGTNPVSVQLRGIEVNTTMDPENYVYSGLLDNAYQLYGYDADWNSVPGGPTADSYSNHINLVKVSESDTTAGGWEIIQPNQWTTLIGTFSPQSASEYVSFAIWFTHDSDDENNDTVAETTPDGPAFWDDWTYDGTPYTQRAIAYVDYILVAPATVSTDLARDIAAGEAYEVQETLRSELSELDTNLVLESDSLMPNGNFAQTATITVGANDYDYASNWGVTGTGLTAIDSYGTRLFTGSGATDTYTRFVSDDNAKGGIISKAVINPRSLVTDVNGNVNSFNIGIRVRGWRDYSSSTSYSAGGTTDAYKTLTSSSSDFVLTGTTSNNWTAGTSRTANVGSVSYSMGANGVDTAQDTVGSGEAWTIAGNYAGQSSNFVQVDISLNGKVGVFVGVMATFYPTSTAKFSKGESPNKGFRIHLPDGFSEQKLWYTVDGGKNWTLATYDVSGDVHIVGTGLNNSGGFHTRLGLMFWIGHDHTNPAGTGWSTSGDSGIRISSMFDGAQVWIAKGAYTRTVNPPIGSVTEEIPNYSIQIVAHESYDDGIPANVFVYDGGTSDGLPINSPHADIGITSRSNTDGQSFLLNLIDLGYSNSTASDEVFIEYNVQDLNESIQDWRNILGSYTPSENCTAVSFEIIADMDPTGDDDGYETIVFLDSATMAVSSVNADLAQTIADNRVFVEQNFRGGQGSIHASNVIQNPNFNEAINIDGTLWPAGWTANDPDWGYDDARSTDYDRVVKLTSSSDLFKLVSRPFEILSTKYRFKCTFRNNATHTGGGTEGLRVYLALTDLAVSRDNLFGIYAGSSFTPYPNPSAIRSSGAVIAASFSTTKGFWTTNSGTQYKFLQYWPTGHGAYDYINGSYDHDDSTGIQTIQFDIELPVPESDRPYARYGSINLTGKGNTEYEIFEVQLIPVGQTYGSGSSKKARFATAYDTDGDPLPDVPRETEATTPLYSAIDIEVHDATVDSSQDSAIMVSMPRKHFPQVDSDDPDGISYFYPGVTDFHYRNQPKTLLTYDGDQVGLTTLEDCRTLDFPNSTHNRIVDMNYIKFSTAGDGLGTGADDVSKGFTADGQSGDSMIDGLGALVFDDGYSPSGAFGNKGEGRYHDSGPLTGNWSASPSDISIDFLAQMALAGLGYDGYTVSELAKIGSHIRGVQSIYVGPLWGYGKKNASGTQRKVAFGLDYIISGGSLNGSGTTLGNDNFNSGAGDTSDQATSTGKYVAQYNRMGGIYIKQTNPGFGVTFLNSADNADHRWNVGTGYSTGTQTYLYFQYSTDENTAPTPYGRVVTSATAGSGDVMNFTGQHRCEDLNNALQRSEKGLIVVSTGKYNNLNDVGKPTINSALPIVELSTKRNQKSCFGVLSDKEDRDGQPREYSFGNFVSIHHDEDSLDRLIINSLGEGAVWVCNINGNLENGDYITTCEIPGYGMLQDDDLLHNYTVAKITQDCAFELDNPYYDCVEFEFEGNTYRKAFVGCTYHCG